MALTNRSTVLGIVQESTEGTPVAPSSVNDFTAIQDDLSFEPSFDNLDNAELKASIGAAKPILGLENPSMSFSHYLRHSGVEGTAPDYNLMIKAILGSESVNSTQRSTTSGSTVSVVKLASGGSDFARGKAVLIKDGTNGYSIRPVLSVSSNDLTLGFNVANAPASGIGVGKCVNYAPLNQSHPTLTMWAYRANSGAIEMMAGARVTEMSVDASAGDLLNASFSAEGVAYYFNPITTAATDTKLDFYDGTLTMVATVAAKTWKDPKDLAEALQTSMNAQGSSDTFTVTYSDSNGKFTIATNGTTLSLLWSSGANTANTIGDKIGFVTASDDTGSTSYLADNAMSWAAAYTPSYDTADPLAVKYHEVLLGDATDVSCIGASSISISLTGAKANINDICAESGVSGSLFTGREATVSVTALLSQNDVKQFHRFHSNSEISFAYNFGVKSGGNWVPGKCGQIYMPTLTLTSFKLGDNDGLITLELEGKAFVDSSGNGEFYVNFL